MVKIHSASNVRLASLKTLREEILPNIISPVPTQETLRAWFDAANIARLKSNPTAKRGGGHVFYSVPAVEKYFRCREMGKVIAPPNKTPMRRMEAANRA